MGDENKMRDAVDAVKGVVEAVPIYQDLLQPAAREVGKALQTVAKTIHIALAPVSIMVWGYERITEFVNAEVSRKLAAVPPERIVTPPPHVAGPVLEALRFTGQEPGLRDMYANLLAASMDADTVSQAHPAFVEIIRQLSPDEARIVALFHRNRSYPLIDVRWDFKSGFPNGGGKVVARNFSLLGVEASCEHAQFTSRYLDNICRLGLAEIPVFSKYLEPGVYDPLESHPEIIDLRRTIDEEPKIQSSINRKAFIITDLGFQFHSICIAGHESAAT